MDSVFACVSKLSARIAEMTNADLELCTALRYGDNVTIIIHKNQVTYLIQERSIRDGLRRRGDRIRMRCITHNYHI